VRSLRTRLAIGLGASLGLLFLLLGISLTLRFHATVEAYVLSRLDHDAESLLVELSFDAQGAPELSTYPAGGLFQRAYSGHYFRIESAAGVLRSRSLWHHDLPAPHLEPGERIALHITGPEDEPLLLRVAGFRKTGRNVTIAVAEDLSQIDAEIVRWQRHFALLTSAFLLALVVFVIALLWHGFRPLKRVRSEIRALERGERAGLSETVPVEIGPLVQEVNRLVWLLGERLDRSRKALGDLAHALKGPLTLLGRLADDPRLADRPAVAHELRDRVEGIRTRIERELKRSRLVGPAQPGRVFCPAEELPPLIATLGAVHRNKALDVDTRISTRGRYAADREDMVELLGNLLDNAWKWAAGRIRVTVAGAAELRISVEDDGPGVPDSELHRLVRRGERLDEAIAGHGLGLAIVHDIARAYGGRLEFGRSPGLGGLRIHVVLPVPAVAAEA
jgi:signal transduction histidine kinase